MSHVPVVRSSLYRCPNLEMSKMRLMHFAWLAASLSVTASSSGPPFGGSNLLVAEVPDHVRPYVVRAYSLAGPLVGPQVYRFPVTGASSGGAFTLISTAAPGSYDLGVLPHVLLSREHVHRVGKTDSDCSNTRDTMRTSSVSEDALPCGPKNMATSKLGF